MKYFTCICLFIITLPIFSQENEIDQSIAVLKEKVASSTLAEKLKWMDSLSNVIAYDTGFENDSIVRATVDYALALDSIDIAVWHTANLLYYHRNIQGEVQGADKDLEKIKPYFSRAKKPKVLSKYFYELSNNYFNSGEFEKSLALYDSTFYYASKANDTRFIGLSKLGKGQVYTDTGEFGKASLTLQDAIRFFQKQNDTTRTIEARNSLTILYSKNSFYEEAQNEREELFKIERARESYDNIPVFHFNAAADYNKMGMQQERIGNLKLALETARLSRFSGFYEPIMLAGLAQGYAENDSIAQAEKVIAEIERDLDKNTTGPYKAYYIDAKKALAFAKKEYEDALSLGQTYLQMKEREQQYEEIQYAERFLYNVNNAMGNKEDALVHFERYTHLRDSIGSAVNVRVLAYYQTLYETEKRDLTIKAQEADIALLDTKNKLQNQLLIFGGLGLLALFGFIVLVRSRNFAFKKQKLQEQFTQDLLQTQENERARIASELHDNVGQKLLLIKNSLHDKEVAEEMDMVGEAIKEVREMSHNLHPFQFEKIGLENSLKNMVETFQKNSNIFYSEEIEGVNNKMGKEKEIVLFRMIQECMTNVEKHSEASACNLSVEEKDKHIVYLLKDNGKGFNLDEDHSSSQGLGMKTLRERANYMGGLLEISSTPTNGTTISIKIPKK